MKPLTLLMLLSLATGCSGSDPSPPASAVTRADLVGSYVGAGHIGDLNLYENGEFECFVFNGMTGSGCVTFEGAGQSKGSWTYEGGRVSFVATNEPADLVVKLSEASASLSDEGLALTIEGTDLLLPRMPRKIDQPTSR